MTGQDVQMVLIDAQIHWVRRECCSSITTASQCYLLANDYSSMVSCFWHLQNKLRSWVDWGRGQRHIEEEGGELAFLLRIRL